jgi:hypothetical protein
MITRSKPRWSYERGHIQFVIKDCGSNHIHSRSHQNYMAQSRYIMEDQFGNSPSEYNHITTLTVSSCPCRPEIENSSASFTTNESATTAPRVLLSSQSGQVPHISHYSQPQNLYRLIPANHNDKHQSSRDQTSELDPNNNTQSCVHSYFSSSRHQSPSLWGGSTSQT